MVELSCSGCGSMFQRPSSQVRAGAQRQFCTMACMFHNRSGEKHPRWAGRASPAVRGRYRQITPPSGGQKYEHVCIAERALGKSLPPKAVVHHVNGDSTDNHSTNLVICQDQAYHNLLHARLFKIRNYGSLHCKRCCVCSKVLALGAFHKNQNMSDGRNTVCKLCRKMYDAERWKTAKLSPLVIRQ